MGNRYWGVLAECGAQPEPLGLHLAPRCLADFLLLDLEKYFLLDKENSEDIFWKTGLKS